MKLTYCQLQCIQDAAAIQPTGPLPVSAPIRKACPTCSRLFMAWAGAPDDDAKRDDYLEHRDGCANPLGQMESK